MVHLLAIAVDRFIFVLIPLRYAAVMKRKTITCNLVAHWIPLGLFSNLSHLCTRQSALLCKSDQRGSNLGSELNFTPRPASCTSSCFAAFTATSDRIRAMQITTPTDDDHAAPDSLKATKMLTAVVRTRTQLWLPHTLMNLYIIAESDNSVSEIAVFAPLLPGIFNSAVNIFI